MSNINATPNVFIPNFSPQNNYEPAKGHGDLVFMTRGVIMDSPNELHKKFKSYFASANEGDLLMFSGSHIACSIAYHEWCEKFPQSRKLMVFNRNRDDYTVYTVEEE